MYNFFETIKNYVIISSIIMSILVWRRNFFYHYSGSGCFQLSHFGALYLRIRIWNMPRILVRLRVRVRVRVSKVLW